MNVQFLASMFLTPPLISLPITNPPCPLNTVQPSMTTFSHGRPRLLPSASLPLFMQMPSSPTSNVEFLTTALRHDSRSSPSPFCAYSGFCTVMLSMSTFSHISGWMFHDGELRNVTPCNHTLRHDTRLTITGRMWWRMFLHSSSVAMPNASFRRAASSASVTPASGNQ